MRTFSKFFTTALALTLLGASAYARGPSPYLPLKLAPEIERDIERVLILGDQSILTRPIPAARVLTALPKACRIDAVTCAHVRRFLERYMRPHGVLFATVAGGSANGSGQSTHVRPNAHGEATDSHWDAAAEMLWQPTDHVLLTVGGLAYEGDWMSTGTILSIGNEYAQLDVGSRDHWWSPMTDSSMLIGAEGATQASITLSNYQPITSLGLQYEIFLQQMAYSDQILTDSGVQTAGHPRLAALHFGAEPISGWAIGVNRLMQYGGGERGRSSFTDFFHALVNPKGADNVRAAGQSQFGNQLASITSRFIFPGSRPFAVSFEYAGEDTSRSRNYLLGNSALTIGIDIPNLWERFDLTYEVSEWQNAWYVHSVYLDGLVSDDHRVIGHWGGDNRVFGDGVGARAHSLRLGWQANFGGSFELQARLLDNQRYSSFKYEQLRELSLRYSRPWGSMIVGAEGVTGRDVFGDNYGYLGAFARYGAGEFSERSSPAIPSAGDDRASLFVDVGATAARVRIDLAPELPVNTTAVQYAPHFGIGARRPISARNDLGVRLELEEIDGHQLLAVRALDFRHRFRGPLAYSVFFGAARYDLGTPAYGYYYGVGLQWRDIAPRFDLNLDVHYADKVARDHLLAKDPVSTRPDSFYDMYGATLSVSWRW